LLPRQGILQNGRSACCEILITERGLYDEAGLDGCLLCNPHSPNLQEIPEGFVYQNRVYEFQCLPFGLSSAPGAFTKTLKPVLAVLPSLGIRIVIYIDDMQLLHQQSKVLQRMFAQVVSFLEKLGFLVKIEKCSVTPSQCIVFLGAKLDSTTTTISLPQPKLSTILDTCQVLLAQGCAPMRTLSTLLGRMSHASQTGIMMENLCWILRVS